MAETENYGLYVTDEDTDRFIDWRKRLSGETDSNMVKIDQALHEKANNSEEVYGVLRGSAWVGGTAPYTQVLAVDGLRRTQNGIISISKEASKEQVSVAQDAELVLDAQEDGSLTVTARGEKPEIDLPVSILLLD